MASILIAFVVAALAIKKGGASPTTANQRSCIQIEVPVSVDTTAIKWLQPRVDSSIDAVDWVRYQTTRTSPNNTESMMGRIPIKETFKINGQLCVPPKGAARPEILQIATHGGGFDKRLAGTHTPEIPKGLTNRTPDTGTPRSSPRNTPTSKPHSPRATPSSPTTVSERATPPSPTLTTPCRSTYKSRSCAN